MTHFHTAFSAVLTCVGTGSTPGSIFKGKRTKVHYVIIWVFLRVKKFKSEICHSHGN